MTDSHQAPTDRRPAAVIDWGQCLAAHEAWLRKVILARTGEPQAVEEVFQQVALAAVQQRAPLRELDKAPAWLHRLAVVHSARHRRKRGRERRAVQHVVGQQTQLGNGYAGDVLAWLLKQERHQQTRSALARLAGADAEILMLKYGERWSYRKISEHLGITEKAVDLRLMRARERLRQELFTMGITGNEP